MSAFAHLLPEPDLEPVVTALWRAADTVSHQDAKHIALHKMALVEARQKIDLALETIEAAS